MQKLSKKSEKKPFAVLVAKVLRKARDNDRITCGVFECAMKLQQVPDDVMLCLLPEVAPNDVTMSIQHKLIEAYCLENNIITVKVTSCESLSKILSEKFSTQTSANQNPVTMATPDCSCVLLDWPPKTEKNRNEQILMDELWPNQVVQLPV